MTETKKPYATASLVVLIILQLIMLGALFSKVPPHPPEFIPFTGIGPLIGVSIATAAAAIICDPTRGLVGRGLSMLAVGFALISYGPQKYVDPQFLVIWPAVIAAQFASLALVVNLFFGGKRDV